MPHGRNTPAQGVLHGHNAARRSLKAARTITYGVVGTLREDRGSSAKGVPGRNKPAPGSRLKRPQPREGTRAGTRGAIPVDGLTHHPRTDGSTHRRQGPASLRWTTQSPRDYNIAPACDLWPPASRRAHRWLCGALTPVRAPEPVARKPPRQAACEQWRPGGGRPRALSVVRARGGRANGSSPRTALTWLLVGLTRWRVTVARIH